MIISEKFRKGMFIVKLMLFVETAGVLYLLKYLFDCADNPEYIINGPITSSQIPLIFEHILMSVTITLAGALIFSILEKRGELR